MLKMSILFISVGDPQGMLLLLSLQISALLLTGQTFILVCLCEWEFGRKTTMKEVGKMFQVQLNRALFFFSCLLST